MSLLQDERPPVVLVTGAAGSVGRALVMRLLQEDRVVRALDQDEEGLVALERAVQASTSSSRNLRCLIGNVRDEERLVRAFEEVETVFHCAAMKHVSVAEYNPQEAILTNVAGTENVLNAAKRAGVHKVVVTSSDKAVNPSSTMGVTKLLAEKLAVTANGTFGATAPRSSVVRFGNVINSSGSVLTVFRSRLTAGQSLPVTSMEMTRFFISMNEAIELCLYTEKEMVGGEIFVSEMGSLSLANLVETLIGVRNYPVDIIGVQPGEKMYEELVTDSEVSRTRISHGRYVVLPESIDLFPEHVRDAYAKYSVLPTLSRPLRSDDPGLNSDRTSEIFKIIADLETLT